MPTLTKKDWLPSIIRDLLYVASMVCPDGRKRGFESTSRSGHLTNFVGRVRQKEKKMPIYL